MKKLFSMLSLSFLLVFMLSNKSSAQQNKFIPATGYWMLVSDVQQKNKVTVQFYSDQHELMYEEIVNHRMNINRRKTKKQLFYALQEANTLFAKHKAMLSDKGLIAKHR